MASNDAPPNGGEQLNADQNAPAPPVPPPAPVLPPPAQVPTVTGMSMTQPTQEMPVVKSESRMRPDGGFDVTERTEVKRTYPPVPRSFPVLHYGGQQPPPQMVRPVPQSGPHEPIPMEHESAARYFDNCATANESVEWEVEVRRIGPDRWPDKKGKKLHIGELARWPIDTFASLRKRVIDIYGGGKYKLAIRDLDNHVRRTIEINASPVSNTPRDPDDEEGQEEEESDSMKPSTGTTQAPEVVAIEKVKLAKELAKQEADLELTKAEIEDKKSEIERKREQRQQSVPQVEALREEMKQSKDSIAQVLQAMQAQTTQLLTMMQQQAAQQQAQLQQFMSSKESGVKDVLALVANKPDTSKDLLAAMQARTDREDQLRREQAEREERYRQEEKVREEKRREREEQLHREQAEKDERYRREREEREERHRQEEKEQQRQFVTMMMQMSDSRNKESVPQMNMLMESIKALNEGNKTFIQAVIETGKNSKGDLAETQKANAALVERTFQTIMESQKGDAGKYERLMEALISNKLESGQRGLQEFMQALQMGEDRAEKLFRMVREAESGEEEATPAPAAVDTNQGFWNNLGNIVMAFLLSRSGNPEVQQGVAAALGRNSAAALTQADYRQVAQGLTPLVGQQMGMPVPAGMVPNQPIPQLPMQQPGMIMPQQPMPQMQPMQMQPLPPIQAPFPMPQPPNAGPQVVPQAATIPQAAQPPQADAESEERLRDTLDEMIETACSDLTDEAREQQWVDYGLDYLPKYFLDRLVACLENKRLDLAVAELRRNTSIDKFARLETLVQTQSKYDLFMKGLIEMIADHRETSGKPPVAPMPPSSNVIPMTQTQAPVQAQPPIQMPPSPVQMAPMPIPDLMPEPASGPPASAVNPPITIPPSPTN